MNKNRRKMPESRLIIFAPRGTISKLKLVPVIFIWPNHIFYRSPPRTKSLILYLQCQVQFRHVRANCLCASLQRTLFMSHAHATSCIEHARQGRTGQKFELVAAATTLYEFNSFKSNLLNSLVIHAFFFTNHPQSLKKKREKKAMLEFFFSDLLPCAIESCSRP